MAASKRTYLLTACIVLVALLISVIWLQHSQNDMVILVVTKSQDDTPSLNPTRLQTAAKLALDDYTKSREKSPKIVHHYITYTGDEQEGYRQARAFLEKNAAVIALAGDFNSAGTEYMAQLATEYQIPHVSFFANDEAIFRDNPWSFSYRARIKDEIELMLQILTEKIQAKKVIIMASDQQNLLPRAEAFHAANGGTGLKIVDYFVYPPDKNDYWEEIEQMVRMGEEFDTLVLFLGAYQLEHFLQQRSQRGLKKPILTTGVVIHPDLLPVFQGVDDSLFTLIPCFFLELDKDHALQSFMQRYKVELGFHRIDSLGPTIYDGFWTLYESIEGAKNRHQLKEALQNYDQERFVGPVAFDGDGLMRKNTYVAVQIVSGKFEEVQTPCPQIEKKYPTD